MNQCFAVGFVILMFFGAVSIIPARLMAPVSPTNALNSKILNNRFISLWNGRDLAGWKPYFGGVNVKVSQLWSARNGVLLLTGEPIGYLRTEMVFSNYHLHVEWRWPQGSGDSGLLIHLEDSDAIWPRSVKCQLKSGTAGELIGQTGVTFSGSGVEDKRRKTITASSENPVGEWNASDVYCRGDTIEVHINGVRQNDIDKVSVREGAIGLQLQGQPIEFRNLWLEQL